MMSTPRVPGGILILTICYKYNYRKVLVFIATQGARSTEPGDPCLSCFTNIYSNVSVCPVFIPHFLGRYFNCHNSIDNQNRIWKYDLALYKQCVTQGRCFRIEKTMALGMGITDGKLLYCHGVAEGNGEKKISILKYNNSTVYECFNNPFTNEFTEWTHRSEERREQC